MSRFGLTALLNSKIYHKTMSCGSLRYSLCGQLVAVTIHFVTGSKATENRRPCKRCFKPEEVRRLLE